MSSQTQTLASVHRPEPLQRLQDAFAANFAVPTVIIDFEGVPFTKPSFWPEGADELAACREWLAELVEECCRKNTPVSRGYGAPGEFATAIPLLIDGHPLGAWLVNRIRVVEAPGESVVNADATAPESARAMTMADYKHMLELLVSMNFAVEEIGNRGRDITVCKTQLEGMRDQMDVTNAMLRLFINTSDAAMMVNDFYTGEMLMLNQACAELFGGTVEGLLGMTCWQLVHPGQKAICADCPRNFLLDDDGLPAGARTWVRYSLERDKWFRCTSQPVIWSHGRLAVMATVVDITNERRAQEKLGKLAYTDQPTGLPNVLCLLQDLEKGSRPEIGPCGVETEDYRKAQLFDVDMVNVDLSSLRLVRDAYGRETANETRDAVISWIVHQDFDNAVLYRVEGDEYCLVIRHPDSAIALRAAKTIMERFAKPWDIQIDGRETSCFCTPIISIVHATKGQLINGDIIGLVERSLDAARKCGGILVYDEVRDIAIREARRMEASLVASVTEGMAGFEVQYQPIVHLNSGKWKAYEALCRWNSPEFGPVPPSVFIPDAERQGLIGAIGLWVLDTAVAQMKALGLDTREDFFLSVNISPLQLMDADFADEVEEILARHDFPGGVLSLEVTESAEVAFNSFTMSIIDRLRRMGIRIALDDFGAGYSTFTNLKNLPVSFLKTEKAFVAGIEDDRYMQHFYYLMSEIAHASNKRLIAEGIETYEQFRIIREKGADFIQGYFFSRPLSAAALPEMMGHFDTPEEVFAEIRGQPQETHRWLDGSEVHTASPGMLKLLDACLHHLIAGGVECFGRALRAAGEYFGLNRAYVFIISGGAFVPLADWFESDGERMVFAPVSDPEQVRRLTGVFKGRGMLISSDAADVAKDIMDIFTGGEEARSFAVSPLWDGGDLLGFVGFDHYRRHSWALDAVAVLKNLAFMMTILIKRDLFGGLAKSDNEILADVFNRLEANILVTDARSGEILWCNDALVRRYPDAIGVIGRHVHAQPLSGRLDSPFHEVPGLSEAMEGFRECHGPDWRRSFIVYDSLAEWTPGRMAVIHYLTDVTSLAGTPHPESVTGDLQWLDLVASIEEIVRNSPMGDAPEISFAYVRFQQSRVLPPGRLAASMEQVSHAIESCVRAGDYVGRLGTHEFLVVLPMCTRAVAEARLAQAGADLAHLLNDLEGWEAHFKYAVVTLSESLVEGNFRFDRLLMQAKDRIDERARSA